MLYSPHSKRVHLTEPLRKREKEKPVNKTVVNSIEVDRERLLSFLIHGSRWFIDQVVDQKPPNI